MIHGLSVCNSLPSSFGKFRLNFALSFSALSASSREMTFSSPTSPVTNTPCIAAATSCFFCIFEEKVKIALVNLIFNFFYTFSNLSLFLSAFIFSLFLAILLLLQPHNRIIRGSNGRYRKKQAPSRNWKVTLLCFLISTIFW